MHQLFDINCEADSELWLTDAARHHQQTSHPVTTQEITQIQALPTEHELLIAIINLKKC